MMWRIHMNIDSAPNISGSGESETYAEWKKKEMKTQTYPMIICCCFQFVLTYQANVSSHNGEVVQAFRMRFFAAQQVQPNVCISNWIFIWIHLICFWSHTFSRKIPIPFCLRLKCIYLLSELCIATAKNEKEEIVSAIDLRGKLRCTLFIGAYVWKYADDKWIQCTPDWIRHSSM